MWHFNCSLLKNLDYLQHVKNWIKKGKVQYAIPIYHPDGILNIHFTISDATFLEMLFPIRGNTRKYKKLKK